MLSSLFVLLAAGSPLPHPQENLAFERGTLEHWHANGFDIRQHPTTKATEVSSAPAKGGKERSALLHRMLVIPVDAGAIRFRAARLAPKGETPSKKIDIYLEFAGKKRIPLRRWSGSEWVRSSVVPSQRGTTFDYRWDVRSVAGKYARIVLVDGDTRPGHSVTCDGFAFVSRGKLQQDKFRQEMNALADRAKLPEVKVYETRHFYALSTATEKLTREQLYLCESIHALFFEHFRKRGFSMRKPTSKAMVAVFDSQAGVEAYVGQTLSPAITGFYHTPSNRLVVYDYAQNRAYQEARKRGQEELKKIPSGFQRQLVLGAFRQELRAQREDTNISTILHEVAHQLSFESEMLDSNGDVPLWLAEGLACYCEPVESGGWQGIGAPNRRRAEALKGPANGKGRFLSLRTMLEDDWLHKSKNIRLAIQGYAQSWALFHWLVNDHPKKLARYLESIRGRRTSDYRIVDFAEAFGTEFDSLEKEYLAHMRFLVKTQLR